MQPSASGSRRSRSPVPPCGVRSTDTRHCHLIAEPPSPQPPTPSPPFSIPLPLPPFSTLQLNPVNFPPFSTSSSSPLSSSIAALLPCCSSSSSTTDPSAARDEDLVTGMDRVHHERNPVVEARLTRSRARSLERQAEKQKKEQQQRHSSTADEPDTQKKGTEHREAESEAAGVEDKSIGRNVFQAELTKQSESIAMPPPAPRTTVAEKTATGVLRVSPTAATKAGPVPVESLCDELAQARKEEGLSEFTGEHPLEPAPLNPASAPITADTQPSSTIAAIFEPAQLMLGTGSASSSHSEQPARQSRKGRVTVRAIKPPAVKQRESQPRPEEERKEEPLPLDESKDARPLEEDNRSFFSTAMPSPTSPIERKESSLDWDTHDSALSFNTASFSQPPSSYSSDADDKALAWQLQQEEFDAAAASRSIHTFLADLSYQPAWLRLALAVCLVINVLLPLLFVPHSTALVTLVCQALQLGCAYWLYRVYDFTPHLMYSCALLLPSLLFVVDAHLLQTGWSDVVLLVSTLLRRPLLLLDNVVQLYLWQWMTVVVQAVELIGGMWLALKVR